MKVCWNYSLEGDQKNFGLKTGTPQKPLNLEDKVWWYGGYKDVFKKGLLPIYEAHNIFQHDTASCHTSGFISSFMEKKGICLLSDWPSQSPDLSIIEPLWFDLKAGVASCRPSNINELWKFCEEQWALIPTENIKDIYQSMPRRIAEVIKMKGRNTRF